MTTAPHDIPRAACFAAMFLTVIGTASITCAKDSSHYVQDGLIACWDGVENAGRGLHAASTETWTDTIGNVSFALTNVVVAEDRMFFSGISFGKLTASDTAATFANANNGTLEIVYASTNGVGSQLLIQSSTASGISLGLYNGNRLVTANSSSPTINFNSGSKTNAIAVRYSSGKAQDSFFVNGSAATKSANDYWKQSNTTTTLGALSNLTGYFKGSIYSIRLYNRRLTNEELASNYAVDLRRFLQGHPYGDDVLTVSGAPDEHGASIPPYGTAVFGLAAGDPVAVSAPAVWTNAAETVAATCVGWKLYDDDDNVVSNGVGNAFTYVHPSPIAFRRLEWQWATEYKVCATANAGGTVSPASQWVADGETAVITATPDSGRSFNKWTNGVPASVNALLPTLSVPVSSPMSLFATFGDRWYVSPTGDGSAPNDGFATGYPTIEEAVSAAPDGDTILLDAATHTLSGTVTVNKGLKIVGQGVGHTFITTSDTTARHFLVSHDDAVLEGLEFVGKTITKRDLIGWVVSITAGTIRSCRISGFTQGQYYQSGVLHLNGAKAVADSCEITNNANNHSSDAISKCAGLYCQNGTVTNCVITGNTSFQASGLWLKNGLVTDTLIAGNKIVYPGKSDKTLGTGTGAYVEGGTMRRCTLVANKGTIYSGVALYVSGTTAHIEDCIVRYNYSPGVNATVWPDVNCANAAEEANFSGCRLAAPFGSNCDTNCPFFADLASGDYTLVRAFTANRAAALEGEAITFTSAIAGDAAWTFTDANGQTTTASGSPVSPVLAPGTYDVTLAIGGETYSAAKAVKIGPAAISPATGAELLQAVADATDGTVITLAADEYELTDTILVPGSVSIIGAGRDATTLKMKSNVNKRVMVLAHPDAVVSNVTLKDGRCDVYGPTRGISLWINKRGGHFTHGRVTASTSKSHYQYGAIGVSSSAGYVGNCVVDGNYNIFQANSGSSHGGGVYAEAGIVENCMVTNNDAFYGAGLCVAGSGSFRNCTVVNNRALKTGGGIFWKADGRQVANCVFMGNTTTSDGTIGAPNWAPETANATQYTAISNAFVACAFVGSAAPSDDCYAINDPFIDYAGGDFHPAAGSAGLVDKGLHFENLPATDLDGAVRIQGEGIDIGCYERNAFTTSCSFDASTTETFYDTVIDFISEIVNPADGTTYGYAWTFTDRAGATTTFTSANPAVSLPAGRYDVELVVYDIANPSSAISSGVRRNYLHLAPRDIYLLPQNEAAAFPWADWTTAGTNIVEAVADAIAGTTIHLGEGVFITTNVIELTSDIIITGMGRDKTTIMLSPRAPAVRVAVMNSPESVIEKVTITGGRNSIYNTPSNDGLGVGVWIRALGGTLRDCRITGNKSTNYYQHGGGVAVSSSRGLVERCVIDGNRNIHREVNSCGGGIYLSAGEARNCIITNNISNIGGGVSLNGGTLRNCTVAFNHSVTNSNHGGGYGGDFTTQNSGGTAINCVFFGGDQTPWNSSTGQLGETVVKEWYGNSAADLTLRNCAFPSARGLPTGFKTLTATDCVLFDDPGFRNASSGNLAIRADSPLKDAGLSTFVWPDGATDLAGAPRVFGKGIDIGAFESQSGAATILLLR